MTKPTMLATALCALFALGSHAAEVDTRADDLLREAKAASGGAAWDGIKTLHETGRLTMPELKGSFQAKIDLVHQHSMGSYDLGALKGANGWDGKQGWVVDPSGVPQALSGTDDLADAMSSVYRDSLSYWYPDRMKASRVYAGERTADGGVFDAVRIEPVGGLPFELWINRTTHRIERCVGLTGDQPTIDRFEDFRDVNGVSLPFKTHSVFVKTGKLNQDTQVDSAVVNEDIAASAFAMPVRATNDITFPEGSQSVTLPFHLDANHIMVELGIDSGKPLHVMFDTGAVNLIDTQLAAQRGIKSEGAIQGGGFGSETTSFGMARVAKMSLGGVSFDNQPFITMDMKKLGRAAGEPFDGLIGREVASRSVVRIDYPANKLTLYKQGTFVPPANAVKLPLKFSGVSPMLEAKVNGVVGEFQLDTGSRSGLWLTNGFAEAHPALGKNGWSAAFVDGFGVGGPNRSRLTRLDTLELGSIKLTNVRMAASETKSGNEGAGGTAGNIGGAIYKHFVLTLDYANSCVYLEPAAGTFSDAGDFDRSGMFLIRPEQGEGIEVLDVAKGSAAAIAGIQAGERIVAVGETSVATLGLGKLREQLMAAPGTQLDLTVVNSKGARRHSTLTLADLS